MRQKVLIGTRTDTGDITGKVLEKTGSDFI